MEIHHGGAKLSKEEKELFKLTYHEIDSSTPNSFAYFIGLAMKTYSCFISFVLPDSILIKDYAKTRKLIYQKVNDVIWYENSGVPQENKVFTYVDHDVCIINISNRQSDEVMFVKNTYDPKQERIVKTITNNKKENVIMPIFDYAFNLKASEKDLAILEKMMKFTSINSYMECHEGIHTGNIRDKLFVKKSIGNKPLFYGGSAGDVIQKYWSKMSGWYVDYRSEIINKAKGEYASLREESIFSEPKIYITRTEKPFKAFYDENSYASNNFFSLQFIDKMKNTESNLLEVLPFINSKVCQYFIRVFAAPRLGSTFVETKIFHLLKFPIPIISPEQQNKIITLVDKIIIAKKANPQADTSKEEAEIDRLVYALYGLTAEEIKIIEGK